MKIFIKLKINKKQQHIFDQNRGGMKGVGQGIRLVKKTGWLITRRKAHNTSERVYLHMINIYIYI